MSFQPGAPLPHAAVPYATVNALLIMLTPSA